MRPCTDRHPIPYEGRARRFAAGRERTAEKPIDHFAPTVARVDLNTRADRLMTLEACLQGASLLQLTEALVLKSDQVFVLHIPRG